MKTPSFNDEDPRQERALARFAAVQMVEHAVQAGQTLHGALEHASQQPWAGRLYAAGTIEDWLYAYRHGRFGALHDKPRSDRGQPRAMEPAEVEALRSLRREHPQLTVKALCEELRRRGQMEEGRLSTSTVHRRLAEAGLDRRSLRAGGGASSGPTKAFEMPLPNLLWMADCMHGLPIRTGDGVQKTFLFALIDDCSRMCPHAQYYPEERLTGFLDTMRKAVEGRGIPDKLYCDNGAAFKSQHLGLVCANLGIRLLHCKPYHSWSKGKVERFFRTVQSQFQPTLLFEPAASIEALNLRFWKWLETDYHQREHAALQGESPSGKFARLGTSLRLVDKNAPLDRWFYMRLKRRVRKDATFSLAGRFWEVPGHFRGQEITVYFDPVGFSRVEYGINDEVIGLARPCNKHRNAQFASSNEYDDTF